MEKTQQPQKPSESAESADLDAALEEKFQQVSVVRHRPLWNHR